MGRLFIRELIIGWWFCASGEWVRTSIQVSLRVVVISHLIDGVCGGSAGRAFATADVAVAAAEGTSLAGSIGAPNESAADGGGGANESSDSPPSSVSLAAVGCLTSCISTSPDGGAFRPSGRWRVVDVSTYGCERRLVLLPGGVGLEGGVASRQARC